MEMNIVACWDCAPDLWVPSILTAILFFAPIGAFVLRKQIAEATGAWKVAGHLLQLAGVLATPLCVMFLGTIVLTLVE